MLAHTDANEFIELNRTFHELTGSEREEDNAQLVAQVFSQGTLVWENLLDEYRVVILSEAGSGKTKEIRNVARKLRAKGKSAFFLRLEHVANDFEESFEEGSHDEFEQWLASADEGWLLLDSVDEARLKGPSDFERAIRKVAYRIRAALQRTHIVITGRTTAWRPKTDRALCLNQFPYSPSRMSVEGIPEGRKGSTDAEILKTEKEGNDEPTLRIVALDDLKPHQIEIFARAKGVEETQPFLDALERAEAHSFTARPQDLADVIEFWQDHRRIGSRLELMRNSVERRLSERDQNRADARPMTAERARLGAKLVAGATTLAQEQTVRVPDGAENSDGLAITSILPDWDDRDCATLLSRPIFDEAIYGTVRFHHRSVREYLAAVWLTDLLARDTSRRSVEELFFREQYGLEVIVPSTRPLLLWLILLDQRIRERALRLAPELIFEGGDPSQLPLETRRSLLREICTRIANDRAYRTSVDYGSVQRFATPELADEITALLDRYPTNSDVSWLLLRMIWQGEIAAALPIARKFALDAKSAKYPRIAAFRAVAALGSDGDKEEIRDAFLNERRTLNREWLAELVTATEPNAATTAWVLRAIEKTQPREDFNPDGLGTALRAFVERAAPVDLVTLAEGLGRLLRRRPVVERRHCQVSRRYRWVAKLAALAAQRLIESKHPAVLTLPVLDVLRLQWMAEDRDDFELRDVELRLPELVRAWPQLNETFFWFEVRAARRSLDRTKGERLTDWWGISLGGSLWAWEIEDSDRLLAFLRDRPLLDDRLIALSLLFSVYRSNDRPRPLREAMWKAVKGNVELEAKLARYMRPPPQQEREFAKTQQRWKRQDKLRANQQAKVHADWHSHLQNHVEKLRDPGLAKPDHISQAQYYLYHQLGENSNQTQPRKGDWKTLVPKHGKDVAQAFRDGCVGYWRRNTPKLRSEGAPANTTQFSTIFGMMGIGIEADEISGWPAALTDAEAELATRYATYELNGFPAWFQRLFAAFPDAVRRTLLREVRWELAHAMPEGESLYVLYDVSWYGEWMWEEWAPILLDELRRGEPANLRSLDQMLKVVQGSSLPNELIRDLAAEKCAALTDPDRLARWFAAWTGVDPAHAIPAVSTRLAHVTDPSDRLSFAMQFVTHLVGGRHVDSASSRGLFRTPTHLKSLYLLMHQHIRQRNDIERSGKGTYSPGLRDNAQEARDLLFNLLNDLPGKEAYVAIMEIARAHPEADSRPWFAHHAKTKAQRDAESGPWSIAQFVDLNAHLERTPANNRELFDLAWMRLVDLKADLEHGDSSVASILQTVTLETEMRKYIGGWLREHARGRYTVPPEEELADATRPDIRFHGVGFDAPVPMELKLADNWTGPHLFERMENQLSADYLRDRRSKRGIFALAYRGEKTEWQMPKSKHRVGFQGLVEALQTHWARISERYPEVMDLRVIGFDLTLRATKLRDES